MIPYIPSFLVSIAWILYMSIANRWDVYLKDNRGWVLATTAVGGSFVAGCSPLGGGAIAYPVMVLAIQIASKEARVFSMMQQSVGMTCASWRIYMTTPIDFGILNRFFIFGIIGFQLGYYLLEIPSPYVQTLYFTFTFAIGVLVQIYANSFYTREDKDRMHTLEWTRRDTIVGVPTLIAGGILFSYVGTGIDVMLYIYLRLFQNVDEVMATNYSVLLAAFMSVFGFFNQGVIVNDIPSYLWDYWLCVIPVVSVFAPIGNLLTNRYFNRMLLKVIIYALETFQYGAGLILTIRKDMDLLALSMSMIAATLLGLGFHTSIRLWHLRNSVRIRQLFKENPTLCFNH